MTAYLILVDDAEPKAANAFTRRVQELAKNWWHWIDDVWIVIDSEERTARFWRDEAMRHMKGSFMIFNLPPGTISTGVLPTEAIKWLGLHLDPRIKPESEREAIAASPKTDTASPESS